MCLCLCRLDRHRLRAEGAERVVLVLGYGLVDAGPAVGALGRDEPFRPVCRRRGGPGKAGEQPGQVAATRHRSRESACAWHSRPAPCHPEAPHRLAQALAGVGHAHGHVVARVGLIELDLLGLGVDTEPGHFAHARLEDLGDVIAPKGDFGPERLTGRRPDVNDVGLGCEEGFLGARVDPDLNNCAFGVYPVVLVEH